MYFTFLGKFASSFAISLLFVYTSEIYPTNLRSQAIGLFSTCIRFFGFGIGFLTKLARFWQPLPMLVIGIPALFVGLLILKLPETKGKPLPQTREKETTEHDL